MVSPYGYRPTGGRLNTQSPHKQYIHSLCSLRSRRALARSRSLALRSSPRLCSARFARCTLATSPAARFVCLACPPARVARRLACCSRFARASPAASRLSLALRAPCLLLASLASSPAARCARLACCSLLTAPPAPLTTSPAALASLAASPAAARVAHRLACGCSRRSPSHLLARLRLVRYRQRSVSFAAGKARSWLMTGSLWIRNSFSQFCC